MPDIVVERSLRERIESAVGSRRDVWILAGAVAAVILVALVLLGRGADARIAPPATSSAAAPAPIAATPTPMVFVDIGGAVRAPGLYSLPAGARVADAIAAAGGPRGRGDLSSLNLAQMLTDGTKIEVPTTRQAAAAGTGPVAAPTPAGGPAAPTLVPLNTADQTALETIPGVGPVTATAILTYRQQIGTFETIDQLLEVDGIGPATLESIRPYVSL